MLLPCPHCRRQLEFTGEPPRFCGYCGRPLGATSSQVEAAANDPTLVRPPPALEPTYDFDPASSPPPPAPAMDKAPPKSIGGYRLLKRLGGGGMGTVYEAEQETTGRHVALKLMSRPADAGKDALARFRQEGRLASQLSHPRCVFVLAVDEDQGRPYIVMELMPGSTLSDLVREKGPLSVGEAVARIADVADGLSEAHRLGLVHRDVKPSNCFLQADGRVKIGDFGLSKSLTKPADLSDASRLEELTRTGAFLGTPLYAAPEQVKGERVDQQADVYAVCATLYFLLTGKAPFEHGGDAMSVMARIVADDPRSMRSLRPELPAALDSVVLKGLERDKRRRWKSIDDLRQALAPFLPQRFGYVGIGLRIGAMLVDILVIGLGSSLLQPLALWLHHKVTGSPALFNKPDELLEPSGQFWLLLVWPILFYLAYFTLFDGGLGRTPGKWLLGLRVARASGGGKPWWRQALVRSLCFVFAYTGVHWATFLIVPPPERPAPVVQAEEGLDFGPYFAIVHGIVPIVGALMGMAILGSSMRRRNGLRGLHELASGTCTVATRPAWLRPSSRRKLHNVQLPTESSDRLPRQVGGYAVRGAFTLEGGEVLVAQESTLDRLVWIWRRPEGADPLPPGRAELSRQARWRWLASGRDGGQAWDAFLAAPGMPLADSIGLDGPMTWKETRPILEQLVEELLEAEEEGAPPRRLSVGQVWLRTDGRAQLLDMSLRSAAPEPAEVAGPARRFLARTAALCLEGQPRAAGDCAPPRTALPQHAAELLAPLFAEAAPDFRLEELKAAFAETEAMPAETTRGRRVGHFFLHLFLCLFLFVGLTGLGVGLTGELVDLEPSEPNASALANASAPMKATATASPSVAGGQRRGLRVGVGLKPPGAPLEPRERDMVYRPDPNKLANYLLTVVVTLPLVILAWSFATRGGLTFQVFGLTLASAKGGPLSRWRCLLRTLAGATPPLLFLFGVWWADNVATPGMFAAARNACGIGLVGTFLLGVANVLWRPGAAWWDQAVGARVVPK